MFYLLVNYFKTNLVKVYRALYDYTAQRPEELSFGEGDLIYITDMISDKDWWKAKSNNLEGFVPSNYSKFSIFKHTSICNY